ncbi:MAG TPA: hypothetical protein VGB74_16625 [Actinoplanes sp.]
MPGPDFALTAPGRLLAEVLACAMGDDRQVGVAEPVWVMLWQRLHDEPAPAFGDAVALLRQSNLVDVEEFGADDGIELVQLPGSADDSASAQVYRLHPAVTSAIRSAAPCRAARRDSPGAGPAPTGPHGGTGYGEAVDHCQHVRPLADQHRPGGRHPPAAGQPGSHRRRIAVQDRHQQGGLSAYPAKRNATTADRPSPGSRTPWSVPRSGSPRSTART